MKKFISIILSFTIISIPINLSVFFDACPPGSSKNMIERTPFGEGPVAQRTKKILGGFNYKVSRAYKLIKQKFGIDLKHEELKSLTLVIIHCLETKGIFLPKLTKDEEERRCLIYKYIDKHLDRINIVLPFIQVEYNDEKTAVCSPCIYGEGVEAQRTKKILNGFNYKVSHAYMLIKQKFGRDPSHKELKNLVFAIIQHLKTRGVYLPELTRDEKRIKCLMYKYIDNHLDRINIVLPLIQL